jgi:thiol-disulfide isomerase/thioredoxin
VLLLVLPVCLLIGWLIALAPGPKPPAPQAAVREGGTTVPARLEPPVAVAPRPSHPATTPRRAEPAPARVEQPAPSSGGDVVSQWTTLEGALAESRRNGKPVLIDFNAEWCGPCRRLKQEVFDDWGRGRVVQTAVIPVSIVDRSREEGCNPPETEDLQQRFQVEAFPTLVVFSPANGRAVRTRGYGDPEQTLAWIREAAQAVR